MARRGLAQQLATVVGRAAVRGAQDWLRSRTAATSGPTGGSAPGPAGERECGGDYPGDFDGVPAMRYAADADGQPDPGEIVWTWVPYEEDHCQGKDRPVLLIGHDGPWLLALQLTSQDHDRDAEQEARAGRLWEDIGSGAWDRRRRPSEVRTNRVLRVDPQEIRREGAILDRAVFDRVAHAVQRDLA